MSRAAAIRLYEVGPRDGLQNESAPVSVALRVELIDRLSACGLAAVEAGAFVNPARVPQMADSAAVLERITRRPGTAYPVLVPNLQGFEAALAAGAEEVAIFAAASESFSRRNINCSIEESFERFIPVAEAARTQGVRLRGYLSCVLGCPYEGEVPAARVAGLSEKLVRLGCYEVSLGDTIGVGTPDLARAVFSAAASAVGAGRLAAHFHDTYGQALANLVAVLDLGVATVDASVAGLGGCPFAPGASGNAASEDVAYLLAGLGVETGIDLPRLAATGAWISGALGRPNRSKAGIALQMKR
jgi:isopropylmalate/homocitrate/citramalate synthase